jgi:hypothetical protein
MFRIAIWMLALAPLVAHAASITRVSVASLHFNNGSLGQIQVENGGILPGTQSFNGSGASSGGGTPAFSWGSSEAASRRGTASANLATGTLKTSAIEVGNGTEVSGSNALARFSEDLTFTNLTNEMQFLDISFTITGDITIKDSQNLFGSVQGFLKLAPVPNQNRPVYRNEGGPGVFSETAVDIVYTVIGTANGSMTPTFSNTSGQRQRSGFTGPGSTTDVFDVISLGGYDVLMKTTIGFRPGVSMLNVIGSLALDCRLSMSCEFGNSAETRFGPLPEGLSYTSSSGVFLSEVGNSEGIPEPGSWLMAAAGLLVVLRRGKK